MVSLILSVWCAAQLSCRFSNISIRRLRKFEIDAALKARGVDPEAHDCDRSSACLKFVAHIPGQKALSVQSETLYCSKLMCLSVV